MLKLDFLDPSRQFTAKIMLSFAVSSRLENEDRKTRRSQRLVKHAGRCTHKLQTMTGKVSYFLVADVKSAANLVH